MTTTPTVWNSEFVANAGVAAGVQSVPVTIGLADGHFLTVWSDDTNNVANNAGNDIVGRIFDGEGNAVGGGFQVNVTSINWGERNPAIAALADGGFVIAYEGTDPMGLPT